MISVRYQSRGGNSKAVADLIAEAFGLDAQEISRPEELEKTELLILGGGVYWGKMSKKLRHFVQNIESGKVKQVALFQTSGNTKGPLDTLENTLKSKGITVLPSRLELALHGQGNFFLGRKGGKLTAKQEEKVRQFVNAIKIDLIDLKR